MDSTSRNGMRRLSFAVLACFIVAPLAAAPLAFGSPDYRPLTISRAIHVVQAYGPDDEDCVFQTFTTSRPGRTIKVKKLVCDD